MVGVGGSPLGDWQLVYAFRGTVVTHSQSINSRLLGSFEPFPFIIQVVSLRQEGESVNSFQKVFSVGFSIITLMFVFSSFILIVFAVLELWSGINPSQTLELRVRFNSVMESIGLLTVAVAALELGQTILDEEVRRKSEMSVPTRVRRFLSRFLIVIIVSLSIEFLVVVFELIHSDPERLPQASTIGLATAALLAAWGIFVGLNKSVEEIEPEALEEVKKEDNEFKREQENSSERA